jgi:hypothetical protein
MNNLIIWGIITYALLFLLVIIKILDALVDIAIYLEEIRKKMR